MKIQIAVSACAALLLSGCMSYSGTYRQDLGYRDYGAYDAPAYVDDDPYYQDRYYGDGYYNNYDGYYDGGYYNDYGGYYGDSGYYGDYYGGYGDPFDYGGNYNYCRSPYDFDCRRDPYAGWMAFGGDHFWLLFGNYRGWSDYYGNGYGWPYWGYPYGYGGYPHHHHHGDHDDDPGRGNGGTPGPTLPRSNGGPLPGRFNDGRGVVHRQLDPNVDRGERSNGGRWGGDPNADRNSLPPPRDNGSLPRPRFQEDRDVPPQPYRRDNGSSRVGDQPPMRWRAPTPMPMPMPSRDNGQMRYPGGPIDRGTPMLSSEPMAPRAATPRPPSEPVTRPVRPISSPTPIPTYEPNRDNGDESPAPNRRRDNGSGDGR
jgi:hypothetical protein